MDNLPNVPTKQILYLVPDLSDPATERRSSMLKKGGATLTIMGFDRRPKGLKKFSSFCLGVTQDGAMLLRTLSIFKTIMRLPYILRNNDPSDIIVARNLEMLLISVLVLHLPKYKKAKLIYECLDLHRILLKKSFIGNLLRLLEKRLLRSVEKIIISSDAYKDSYFHPIQNYCRPVLLLENKISISEFSLVVMKDGIKSKFTIGYFGMLRCRRSFHILKMLGADCPILDGVFLAGIPSPAIFPNFNNEISATKKVKYLGSYDRNEIGHLYQQVDFAWCIDFYEAGLNSNLLLPNRLYESIAFGTIPLAMSGTATAKWLDDRKIGRVFSSLDEIKVFFDRLDSHEVKRLQQQIKLLPVTDVAYSEIDCINLVNQIFSENTI